MLTYFWIALRTPLSVSRDIHYPACGIPPRDLSPPQEIQG